VPRHRRDPKLDPTRPAGSDFSRVPVVTLKRSLGAILKLNLVNQVDSGRFQTISDMY
jgi:hypothetical protein